MVCSSGRVCFTGLALLCCGVLVGCSSEPNRTTVQGKVTWNGKEPNLKGLRISFIGSDDKSVTAEVAPNGDYSVSVLPGANMVMVSWQAPDDQVPRQAGKPKKNDKGELPEGVVFPERVPSPIPIRYASPATSGLKCTIEADTTNTYNVDLTG